jgi:GntR family transcriptional regulator/GntR family frlABCD operon transcriptional regulator
MTQKKGYLAVQNDLKRLIITGYYSLGDMLPSENKLSEEYSLSRMTIRIALKNLETEGLIYRKQGKGSFVGFKRKSVELLTVKGFSEVMRRKNAEIDTRFIQKPHIREWEKDFYWDLHTEERESGCISLSRVRSIQNKPVMYEETYLSNTDLENFSNISFTNNSLFDTLSVQYKTEITGVTQNVRAILAPEYMAKYMEIDTNAPVLEIMRKLTTTNPNIFIYSFVFCNTNEFTIEI